MCVCMYMFQLEINQWESSQPPHNISESGRRGNKALTPYTYILHIVHLKNIGNGV